MARMSPDERYQQLLAVAVDVADSEGFLSLTHSKVANRAGVVKGTVFHHFKTIDALRDDVMKVAVKEEMLRVIASGLAMGNKIAIDAPTNVKKVALASII